MQKLLDNPRRTLIGIIVLAVILRVGAAIYLGNTVEALPGTFDQVSYHNLALRLLGGHGFTFAEPWWPLTPAGEPTAHWSYLYTLYVTAVYFLTGSNPIVARLIQAVAVGILMPLLTYRIATRLFSRRSGMVASEEDMAKGVAVGLTAAAITAVYIYFFYYAAALMTESFYIVSILWSFDVAIQMVQEEKVGWKQWLLLGLVLSVTVLLRQLFLLFVPFLLLWMWWSVRPKLYYLAVPLIVIFLMMLPWMIRNYQEFDQFVLLNTNSGYAFFWGNHPIHGARFISILPSSQYQELVPEELRDLNEAALDTALLELAMENILADPGRYILLSISRIPPYFTFWPSSESGLLSNVSRLSSFALFLPFMVVGLVRTLLYKYVSFSERIASPFTIIYAFMLIYTGIHLLTWTLIRYRLPVDAFLIIFAGLSIIKLWEWYQARRRVEVMI